MKTKFMWLATVTLLAALMISGTAFAEGEVPPALPEDPAAVVVETAPPADGPSAPSEPAAPAEPAPEVPQAPAAEAPAEEPPAAEAPADETALVEAPAAETPLDETSLEEAPAVEEAAPAEVAEEPALQELPAEEPVIQLVDAEGEALDMASQESGEILKEPDPYFTSGGILYGFTASDCNPIMAGNQPCSNPIQEAVNFIQIYGTIPDDHTIYVEKATYTGNVTIDGSLPYLDSLTALMNKPDPSGFPTINGIMTLSNLTNGFWLEGFTVTGGVVIKDTTTSSDIVIESVTAPLSFTDVNVSNPVYDGISVTNHKGNVTMTRVNSSSNSGFGAYIVNHLGGNVTVNSSTFNDNDEAGLLIISSGVVTLNTVTANGNNAYGGIYIDTHGAVTLTNIKANQNTTFSNGIQVVSSLGAVTINNAVANDNSGYGLNIIGRGVTIRNAVARGNGLTGLDIYLDSGAGLLENVVASDNGGLGVQIGTTATNLGAVTLKNMNARNNALGGIHVESLGAVTVTNSTTDDNFRKNDPDPNTGGDGLYISTKGAVTLTGIWSSGNGGNGLKVEGVYGVDVYGSDTMVSPTSITLTSAVDPNFANYFTNNGQLDDWDIGRHGITIITEKPVTIRNFSAMDNLGNGVSVDGPYLEIWDPDLPLWGWILPEETEWGIIGYGGYTGVSKKAGVVTITSTIPNWRNSADRNDFGVAVYSTGAVSLSFLNTNENRYHAVEIMTLGGITLSNVRDWGNGEGKSVGLYNHEAPGFMPITITNLEVRETRGGWGAALEVHSRGAITINGLWLENNNSLGAALANEINDGRGNISLTNATINNNAFTGIQAYSNGAILFTNVSANWNGWGSSGDAFGGYLDNSWAPGNLPVTLTDCVFEGNQGTGLDVKSRGVITLRGVETRGNYIRYGSMDENQTVYETNQPDWGVDEWSFYYDSGAAVTITLRSTDEWEWFQPIVVLLDSNGNEVTTNVAHFPGDGVWTSEFTGLDQYQTYTIQVQYDDTVSDGWGKYSLSVNDDSESNPYIPADGAVLDNTFSTTVTPPGVLASSTTSHPYNLFEDNNGTGLNINTRGAVTLTNLYANNNAFGEGLFMDNEDAIGAVIVQNLPVTNPASFSSNGGNGLYIRTLGAITLSNVEAFNNRLSGADLDNAICEWDGEEWINCLGTGSITIKSPSGISRWFNDNQNFGIWALSKGAITLTNISAVNNGYDGTFLRNNRGNSSALVSVGTLGAVRNEFSHNGWNTNIVPGDYYSYGLNGLSINSGGVISVSNTSANWNQNGGGGLMLNSNRSSLPKTITITNVETYGNDWAGIWAMAKGVITLTKVNASDNGYDGGIYVDNCLNSLGGCQGSGGVTMTTISADNNGGSGLIVYSKGAISLTNAWVNNNKGSGIRLVNNYNYIGTLMGITMTNVNANDNQGMGLEALSRGLITLRGGEGSNNGDGGMRLNNTDGTVAGITILNASAYNNNGTGISLETNGALLMTSLVANDNARTNGGISSGETVQDFFNQDRGMDNWWFDAEAGVEYTLTLEADTLNMNNKTAFTPEIELIDPSTEEGWENPLVITGLYTCDATQCVLTFIPQTNLGIDYDTTLVLRVGSTSGDGFYRLFMEVPLDEMDDDPDQQYWVNGLYYNAGGNVNMTGFNSFHHNSLTGVIGLGAGNITTANVAAFSNGTEGVLLDNTNGIGYITMSGANVANNNGYEGLRIETNGAVNILSSLEASNNSHRVDPDNNLAAVRINAYGLNKAVTLANITALNNGCDGLEVRSNGSATFTNVRSWMNGFDGLDVIANGLTTFTGVNAWLNGWNGVRVDSNGFLIKALTSTFTCNGYDGFGYAYYPTPILTTGSVSWGNDDNDWKPYF